METSRKDLRPQIATDKEAFHPMEQFQNDVLRPILKMQNDLILSIYRHFLHKRKVPFNGMSREKRADWIRTSISKDNRLRGIMLGLVVGQFVEDELAFFLGNEGEVRRRITELISQRLQHQVKHLL
jgi:hypothetical protein